MPAEPFILRFAALLLAALSPALWALPDDRSQPIEIEANQAMRDDARGLTVYEGDVVITQGSILIRADKVSIFGDGRQVTRVVGEGNPAHYEQVPEVGKAPVVARARTISYEVGSEKIILTRDASLRQEEATLTGERIEYDLLQEIIRAQGGDDNQRIRMVIPPSQQGAD